MLRDQKMIIMFKTNSNKIKIKYDEATPSKLILIAVIAGVNIKKYFTSCFSATNPNSGLKSAGVLLIISKKATSDKLIFSLLIINGSNGAKNEEKISWAKCADDIV